MDGVLYYVVRCNLGVLEAFSEEGGSVHLNGETACECNGLRKGMVDYG